MNFIGNVAILELTVDIKKGMNMVKKTKVLQHSTEQGYIQLEIDINYIRKIKTKYPLDEL